jgi:hypothetical protein
MPVSPVDPAPATGHISRGRVLERGEEAFHRAAPAMGDAVLGSCQPMVAILLR